MGLNSWPDRNDTMPLSGPSFATEWRKTPLSLIVESAGIGLNL